MSDWESGGSYLLGGKGGASDSSDTQPDSGWVRASTTLQEIERRVAALEARPNAPEQIERAVHNAIVTAVANIVEAAGETLMGEEELQGAVELASLLRERTRGV